MAKWYAENMIAKTGHPSGQEGREHDLSPQEHEFKGSQGGMLLEIFWGVRRLGEMPVFSMPGMHTEQGEDKTNPPIPSPRGAIMVSVTSPIATTKK